MLALSGPAGAREELLTATLCPGEKTEIMYPALAGARSGLSPCRRIFDDK